MHVIATAGHVDHGKSTLVRALTGTDPDRLEEEHRRGLSITLGYCWTRLDPVGDVAFVDVPGHERFVSTMMAGVGPVPAVLFVVAADDGWMPQSSEHLAVLDALGVERGVLAVTRSDLADPRPAMQSARARLAETSLRDLPTVAVSGRTGAGLDRLREALVAVCRSLPPPDVEADVRLWVDRRFHVRGSGTVVTGTLPAGRLAVGDVLAGGGQEVRVRGLQSLGRPVREVRGVARVALALGGGASASLERGDALVTPHAWLEANTVDVRLRGTDLQRVPQRPQLHVGATSVGVHPRLLGVDVFRLRLEKPLPLRIGDGAVLRDPGSRRLWGVTVLDVEPEPLRRRGAAVQRAKALADHPGRTDLETELGRRRIAHLPTLRRLGVQIPSDGTDPGVRAGEWLVDSDHAAVLGHRLETLVSERGRQDPLDPGLPVAAAARALGVPTPDLVRALVRPPLRLEGGRVHGERTSGPAAEVVDAVRRLADDLAENPFAAPDADRLADLGLNGRVLAAADRAGLVLRVGDAIVLLPGADRVAAKRLRGLPQPFTTSQARQALGTTRRVAIPLLDHLDRIGLTHRLPDDRRRVDQF